METKLELLKSRDFGEIISDSFVFVKQNFKPLITCFFVFCGFFLLGSIVSGALQQIKVVNVVNDNFSSMNDPSPFLGRRNPFATLGITYVVNMLFALLDYVMLTVTVFSFICLYREKGNIAPTPTEVWGYIKYFFLKIFGSTILLVILLLIAFILCLIPGIYLYPILGLIFPVMVFENTTFSYAFSKSFKLISNNWWQTFGCIIVMDIIVYFAMMIVVLPATILNLSGVFLHPEKGMHLSATITVITLVLQHLLQVLLMLPLVTISLCYFNLSEIKEATGLMNRISQIGAPATPDDRAAEEY